MDIFFEHAFQNRSGRLTRAKAFDFGRFLELVVGGIQLTDHFFLRDFDVQRFLNTAHIFNCNVHGLPFYISTSAQPAADQYVPHHLSLIGESKMVCGNEGNSNIPRRSHAEGHTGGSQSAIQLNAVRYGRSRYLRYKQGGA
jgi:hypothetical protein